MNGVLSAYLRFDLDTKMNYPFFVELSYLRLLLLLVPSVAGPLAVIPGLTISKGGGSVMD